MQTTNNVRVLVDRRRETRRARATTHRVNAFQRGGFDDASPVCGEQTTLRPVEENDVERLLAWHADPDVTPFLVLTAGDPIGYLQVWGDAGAGGLDMFLEPSARGRGLGPDAGAAMARHLLEQRGWARVTVDPYVWNVHAARAWRKAGFVDVSRHEPDDEHTAQWMLLEFSPYPVR